MINNIIKFSINNKLTIGLFIIVLLLYGIYEAQRLPIDAVPDITNNQVQIITVAPALGATDIERLITIPIEQANSNIPQLKELRSYSTFGLSVITVVLEDDIDIYWVRQQISERLQQLKDELPKGFGTPFLAPVTTGLGEIYQYVVRPKIGFENKYSAMELRTIQDWIIRKQLLGVNGVADVSSFGGLLKQYEIAIEPEKLLANNITISEVFTALEKNNQNTGGSYIEKGSTALFIRSEGMVENIDDIKNIAVKNLSNGIPLLISDVAEVRLGNATRYGALTYNGELQVSGAVVMMLKGANSNDVIKKVKQRIEIIKKSLPEGVTIEPFIDRTKMVNNAVNTVTKNLMEGALIVVFVLVLFLGNLRAGLLVASVIPLSMLFAIILMNLFDISGNLMSLGALDFGLIVDGAVIIVEAIMHRILHNKHLSKVNKLSQSAMNTEVNYSASRMMNSAVFGQIIILVVYLPLFTLQGIEGKMFKPMAQTVAFALVGAFLLSITYIPMMSSLLLRNTQTHMNNFSERMMRFLEQLYQKSLFRVLRRQKIILISTLSLLAIAIVVLNGLGGEFIPALPEGDFAVEVRVIQGSNLNTSIEAASKASKILLSEFEEVERVVTKTGSSEVPTDPMPLFASDMIVVLKSRNEWKNAKTYSELESKMIKKLEVISGVSFSFQFPVAMRFNELISGAKQDVVCKIFGENMDSLSYYANRLGKICSNIEGSSGVYVESVGGLPQITIHYDRAKMAQYGLNISNINSIIKTAFAGEVSGTVYEGEKRFDLVVRLKNNRRKDLSDVQNLLIPTPQGFQIPLNAVAQVQIIEGLNQIQRENLHRRIIVGFNIRGRDVQSTVHELQQKAEEKIKLPSGYYIAYGGAFENLEAAKARLYIAVPISLCLIFLMLYFAFQSVKLGLLVYTAIPLSAIGGIFALAMRGIPFSISAGVGFIALFGVAVLNGIVLISEYNRLKSEGYYNLKRIVVKGTKIRLRPVLMTAFVASLGFIPMAVSHGEGAEVQRPLATVVIGGLLIATLLTLFILPVLFILFNAKKTITSKGIGAILPLLIFLSQQAEAQVPITLQQSIDTALTNNLSVKNEKLKAEYQKKLISSGASIPQTNIYGEYGQINSFYSDTRVGISQSINFPVVYVRQKSLLREEWKSMVLHIGVKETILKKHVSQVFYALLSLQKKKEILERNDSIFKVFSDKASLRFTKGETNILEKITAENQRGKILLQLKQLKQDIELLQLQFQLLLNTPTKFTAKLDAIESSIIAGTDAALLTTHPTILYYKKQQQLAAISTKLERSKLSPNLNFAYNLMGMRGTGADNITYDNRLRFQSLQLGIGLPIFSFGEHSKIKAAKIYELVAENEYKLNLQLLENEYQNAYVNFQKYEEAVKYYETAALRNADTLTKTANQQFLNGNINYLEWVVLIAQATTVQNDYIDAVNDRNYALVELKYFLNK